MCKQFRVVSRSWIWQARKNVRRSQFESASDSTVLHLCVRAAFSEIFKQHLGSIVSCACMLVAPLYSSCHLFALAHTVGCNFHPPALFQGLLSYFLSNPDSVAPENNLQRSAQLQLLKTRHQNLQTETPQCNNTAYYPCRL